MISSIRNGEDQPFVQAFTPPWRLQAPRRLAEWEYIPSLHCAIAPVGLLSSLAPDDGAAGAELARERVDARAVAAGAGAGRGVGALAFVLADAEPAIPPCLEHAPRPALPSVPSEQVTVAAAAAVFFAARASALAALFAALVAAASTPPCPAQAPRPEAADGVPSLQMEAAA